MGILNWLLGEHMTFFIAYKANMFIAVSLLGNCFNSFRAMHEVTSSFDLNMIENISKPKVQSLQGAELAQAV
jgi:hypothetical protein